MLCDITTYKSCENCGNAVITNESGCHGDTHNNLVFSNFRLQTPKVQKNLQVIHVHLM